MIEEIILIEDDRIDARTTERAIHKIAKGITIRHFINGIEAIEYLENDTTNHFRVILLDINTPGMDGVAFLKRRTLHPKIKYIPTVVLSTSRNSMDVKKSYEYHASGYMVKPLEYEEFNELLAHFLNYYNRQEIPKT